MTHDLIELNQYTGFFTGLCALFLFSVAVTLGSILKAFHRFHADYVKINTLDDGEELD